MEAWLISDSFLISQFKSTGLFSQIQTEIPHVMVKGAQVSLTSCVALGKILSLLRMD